MELTTREAAERLGVSQSRARALVTSGRLAARRVGNQWLVDAEAVERQASLLAGNATGRPMAPRIAWAAGDLADGGKATWLSPVERWRLRGRLSQALSAEVVRRWLDSRAPRVVRYRIGDADMSALLAAAEVVRTGVSATEAYGLGLGALGVGDAYVANDALDDLVRDFYLIEAQAGNLTLRVVDHRLHVSTARTMGQQHVAPRLIVGADLADDRDARTRTAGNGLLATVLTDLRAT